MTVDDHLKEGGFHYMESAELRLTPFSVDGRILDIGGGGEGMIGRLMGPGVVAIDTSRDELDEAPDGPLKILMDARSLRFLDGTFAAATAFFSFLYLRPEHHPDVLREVHRVLLAAGTFRIWDVDLHPRGDRPENVVVQPLVVHLPEESIETGYGALWPEQGSTLDHYLALAEEAGFRVLERRRRASTFYLELGKL